MIGQAEALTFFWDLRLAVPRLALYAKDTGDVSISKISNRNLLVSDEWKYIEY